MTLPDPAVTPTLDVEEAGRLLGISRGTAYEQARRYEETNGSEGLPVIRLGKKLRVPTAAVLRMLNGQ